MLKDSISFVPMSSPAEVEPLIDSVEARNIAMVRVLGPGAADAPDCYADREGNLVAWRHPYITEGEIVPYAELNRARIDRREAVLHQLQEDMRGALINGYLSGYFQHPAHGGWYRLPIHYWSFHGPMEMGPARLADCTGVRGYDEIMEDAPIFLSRGEVEAWAEKEYAPYATHPTAVAPRMRKNADAWYTEYYHALGGRRTSREEDEAAARRALGLSYDRQKLRDARASFGRSKSGRPRQDC